MLNATLSLVIPSYNRASLIAETIESALNQSLRFAEIIVVNDGSTDNTLSVLSQYTNRIRVISTPNRGVQAARNEGIAAAHTSYVTLCDSDDLLEPEFVSTIQSWLNSAKACLAVYANFIAFDEAKTYPPKFSQAPVGFFDGAIRQDGFYRTVPDLYLRTLAFQPLFCSGVTFEKALYQSLGGFDSRLKGIGSEDWEFTLRAIAATDVALCEKPLVRIRKHANNDSRDTMRQNLGEALVLEHALTHHPLAKTYSTQILSSIGHRRIAAFDSAFSRSDLKAAKNILKLLTDIDFFSVNFLIKKIIVTCLPSSLASNIINIINIIQYRN